MKINKNQYSNLKPYFFVWLGFLIVFASCKDEKEFLASNQAPTVRLSIDSIGLPDSIRLVTKVRLNWSGEDADGYIKGFRVAWSTDSSAALNQLRSSPLIFQTDSTFLFNFSGGSDNAAIHFYVLSIDNKDVESTQPAHLKIPVRNSRPNIQFVLDGLPKGDTIWSVISLPYSFGDPDGSDNIDSIYFKINNGNWVPVPKRFDFLSLVPEDPSSFGETHALMYSDANLATANKIPTPISGVRIPGLVINAKNRIYVRITDLAGATSTDSTKEYFFRRKSADLLLVDGCRKTNKDSLYTEIIGGLRTYDRLDLNFPLQPGSKAGINQPVFWNASFYLLCKLYKQVFWYSDEFPTNQPAGADTVRSLLSPAAASLNQYLRFDGKLLVSAKFDDGRNQPAIDDPIFSLLPLESIYRKSDTIRIRPGGIVLAKQPGYSDLRMQQTSFTSTIVTGIDIFNPKPGVDTLYVIPKVSLGNTYLGTLPMPIALRSKNPFNNRTNLVFFGMELFNLSLDKPALTNTFSKIIGEEFNW